MTDKQPSVALLGDTAVANHHGCWLVMHHLIQGLKDQGLNVIARHSGKQWSSSKTWTQAMDAADLLVINGEGTMHHDAPLALQYLDAAEVAHQRGIPSVLVNASWHANSKTFTERAGVFRAIFVRDASSQAALASEGVGSTVVPDLTFATRISKDSEPRQGYLVSDSTMDEVSVRLLQLANQLPHTRFLPVISRDWSRASRQRQIKRWCQWLLGRCLLPLGLRPLRSYRLVMAEKTAAGFLDHLLRSQCLVTGRFHAVCLAIVTRTPFLVLRSNTPKIESLLADVGLSEDRLIDLEDLQHPGLPERLQQAGFSPEEEAACQRFLENAAQGREAMWQRIASLVKS